MPNLFSLATEHPKELAIVADQFYFLLQPQETDINFSRNAHMRAFLKGQL